MAILAGLNSAPIHRLSRTWALISAKTKETLEELRETMNPSRNFGNYRDLLRKTSPPSVPFLGFYLTDLTFIEDGNPDMLKDAPHLINFAKRARVADVIREIQQYQEIPYAFQPVPELQDFLGMQFDLVRESEDLYELSLQLEPKEREDEKIARLLHESGFL
jgi:son of sevenless-like protein